MGKKIISTTFITLSVAAVEMFIGLLFGLKGSIVMLLLVAVCAFLLILSVSLPNTFSNTNQNSLLLLFAMALAAFLIAVTIAMIFNFQRATTFPIGIAPLVILLSGCSVLVAAIVVNRIIHAVRHEKYRKIRMKEVLQGLLREREEIEKFSESIKKIRVLARVNSLSYAMILLAFAAVFIGAVGMTAHGGFIFVALSLAILQAFVVYALLPTDAANDGLLPASLLSPMRYPLLHRLVAEAARLVGVSSMCKVYLGYAPNVSIRQVRRGYEILIGKDILRMLSEDELKSVMMHEFAHAAHGDLRFGRSIARMEAIAKKKTILQLFVGAQMSAMADLAERYRMVCSKRCEEAADRTVLEKNLAQPFIDATAKMTMLEYYADTLPERNIYEEETFDGCFSVMYFMEFLKCYETHGGQWRKMCRIELPARFGTHPACSERMRNLQVVDFKIDYYNVSDDGMKESKMAYALADKLTGFEAENWEEMRKANYLKPLELVAAYEGEQKVALKEVADAYHMLCRYDAGLEVLDKILAENPKDAYALYQKGNILCGKEDLEGVEYLKRAADANPHYTESAIEQMFNFVARRGLVAKRQSLRDWADTKMDEQISFARDMAFRKHSDVARHDLPHEVTEKLQSILKAEGILSCRILKDGAGEKTVYHLMIEPLQMAWADDYSGMGQRIFNELAAFEQTFYMVDARSDKVLEKKAAEVGAEFVFCEPNSRYWGGKTKYTYERRRSSFDFGIAYLTTHVVSLAVGLVAVILCAIGLRADVPVLWMSTLPISAVFLGIALVLVAAEKLNESKERICFEKGQFSRHRFTIASDHAEKLQGLCEEYLKGVSLTKKEYGANKEEVYTIVGLGAATHTEIHVKMVETTLTHFTFETFLTVHKPSAVYEVGMYGPAFYLSKRHLKRYTRSLLNVACAPADVVV